MHLLLFLFNTFIVTLILFIIINSSLFIKEHSHSANNYVYGKVRGRSSLSLNKPYTRSYSTTTPQFKKQLFKWFSLSHLSQDDEIFISSDLITELVAAFWKSIFELHKEEIILFQVVIRTENVDRSISKM